MRYERRNRMKLFYYLPGGRPMNYSRTMNEKKNIYIWYDIFGRYWIANNRWSLYRIRWK